MWSDTSAQNAYFSPIGRPYFSWVCRQSLLFLCQCDNHIRARSIRVKQASLVLIAAFRKCLINRIFMMTAMVAIIHCLFIFFRQ